MREANKDVEVWSVTRKAGLTARCPTHGEGRHAATGGLFNLKILVEVGALRGGGEVFYTTDIQVSVAGTIGQVSAIDDAVFCRV